MKTEIDYLYDIVDAASKIEKWIEPYTKNHFFEDEVMQSAIERQLTIIGEAVHKLSKEFKASFKHIDWIKMSNFRHRLVHAYDNVNEHMVWSKIKNIHNMKDSILKIISEIE